VTVRFASLPESALETLWYDTLIVAVPVETADTSPGVAVRAAQEPVIFHVALAVTSICDESYIVAVAVYVKVEPGDTALSAGVILRRVTPVTVIEMTAVVEPPEFAAVIVKFVAVSSMPGVPEITPVVVFSVSPAGSAGLTDQLVTVPVTVGTLLVITAFRVYSADGVE